MSFVRSTNANFGLPHKVGAMGSRGCHLGCSALRLELRGSVVLGEVSHVLGLGHGLSAGGDGSGGLLQAFGEVRKEAVGVTGGGRGARRRSNGTGSWSLARRRGSLTVAGNLGLRLRAGQSQVAGRIQRLAHRLRIFAVELRQRRSSTDDLFVLVGAGEVVQAQEVHLFGAPDVTAGQPSVSAEHRKH